MRALPPLVPASASAPVPVVVDCDPGVDDAVALLLALASPELEVLAVTTVAGNAGLDVVHDNAARVLDLAGAARDLPLARGPRGPLARWQRQPDEPVHGEGALGGVELPPSSRPTADGHAVEVTARALARRPGEVVLVALGPLTGVATLLATHPEAAGRLREVVLMGGAAFTAGNVTPSAEFNLHCDPEAARYVAESGVPLRVVPLDATQRALVPATASAELAGAPSAAGRAAGAMLTHLATAQQAVDGLPACAVHDALAVAAVLDPGVLTWVTGGVSVECAGELTRGELVVDTAGTTDWPRTARVAVDADPDAVTRLLLERLGR